MKNCRYFNGYKPCGVGQQCDAFCSSFSPMKQRVLVVGLGAMGAVLRATAVLPALVRKLPGVHVTWLTEPSSLPLLENNPLIDQAVGLDFSGLLKLEGQAFDSIYVMDKDLRVGGVLNRVRSHRVFGFKVDPHYGVIIPAGIEAHELYAIGLSDQKKFFENQKSEIQLLTEAFGLQWQQDPYVLELSEEEKQEAEMRRSQWVKGKSKIIGLNTGCSPTIPHKKLSIEGHQLLIKELKKRCPQAQIVLLGGRDDGERNRQMAQGLDIIESPTENGLRDGLVSVNACDVIFSGDSLGMHMAIALRKWVVAWFGPTCAQEIELYGRGEKIMTQASCHPCWKRVCDKTPMCYDQVDFTTVAEAIQRGLHCISSSSRQPFWETCF